MKILVTGCNGFIGKTLCEELVKNHKIIGIGSRATSTFKNNNFLYKQVNLLDNAPVLNINDKKIDLLIHLSSKIDSHNYDSMIDNIKMTQNILNLCKTKSINKIIFASSMSVYDYLNPEYLPIDEKHPTNPLDFYGVSKICSEQLINIFCKQNNGKAIILRFCGIYGQGLKKGAIYHISTDLKKGEIPHTENITRDYIYIKEAVKAIVLSIQKINDLNVSIFNIGSGEEISLSNIVELIKYGKIENEVYDELENRFYFNINKAKEILRFNPDSMKNQILEFTNEKE